MDCCFKINKFIIFIFNFVFVIGGLALIVIGSIVQWNLDYYEDVYYSDLEDAAIILIFTGVFIFVVAFCGCCGAIRESKWLLYMYCGLLVISAILLIIGSIIAYIYIADAETNINKTLTELLEDTKLPGEEGQDAQAAWDKIQTSFYCCGINSSADWSGKVPDSCKCSEGDDNCGVDLVYDVGCLQSTVDFFTPLVIAVASVGIIFAVISMLGIALSCCLVTSSKKRNISV